MSMCLNIKCPYSEPTRDSKCKFYLPTDNMTECWNAMVKGMVISRHCDHRIDIPEPPRAFSNGCIVCGLPPLSVIQNLNDRIVELEKRGFDMENKQHSHSENPHTTIDAPCSHRKVSIRPNDPIGRGYCEHCKTSMRIEWEKYYLIKKEEFCYG